MKLVLLCAIPLFFASIDATGATPKAPQSPAPNLEADAPATSSTINKAPNNTAKIGAAKEKATTLGAISTDVEGEFTIVTVRLNQKPEWSNVELEEHGTFLQIKFPKTQVPASGEFIDGSGPFLKKIATFQLPENDGAIRLFLNLDAAKAKLATTAELLGERIVISIDHKKLDQLITPQNTKSDALTADDVVAKTVVDKSQPAPSDQISNSKVAVTTDNQQGLIGQDFYQKMARVAALGAVLLGALIAIQTWRSKRRGATSRFRQKSEQDQPTMKILSNLNIGQRQRLTLVQVGSQQLLLGVSSDSINLLTAIESPNRHRDFSLALDAANPNATVRLKAPDEVQNPRAQKRSISTTQPVKGGRINVGVGDDGVAAVTAQSAKTDDITKLLRDRLRNIPPR
jgi:flagellar biosynthetic protein FliO